MRGLGFAHTPKQNSPRKTYILPILNKKRCLFVAF